MPSPSDFNDLAAAAGLEVVAKQIRDAERPRDPGEAAPPRLWPKVRPITADLPDPPQFDGEALLPKPLREFVLDEADRMPCPPDYVAAALLVSLGSVIGARVALKPKRRDDWIVTPNLYGGVIGDPSTKKSPGMQTAIRFIDMLGADEAKLKDERQRVYQAECAAFEARQSHLQNQMKKAAGKAPKAGAKGQKELIAGGAEDDEEAMREAVRALAELQPPEEPKERKFKTNDSTVPKVGDLLARNPAGFLVFRDELVGLLASWEREGNEGDAAFYLEAFNGTSSYSIDRVARGSQFIPTLCLSVFGGMQPDLLERYLAQAVGSLGNDGRFQRFQVLVYPLPVPWEWRDRTPVPGAREHVRDLFRRLAHFDPVEDGAAPATDFVKLPYYVFDDLALEFFIEWCTALALRIEAEQMPLMRQHLAKFERLFCGVALILHCAAGQVAPAVTLESARYAAAWCEYLEGHARRVYGLIESARVTTAKMLGRRLIERKLAEPFTAREVWKKGWTGINSSMQAEQALGVLEDHGWIVADDGEAFGRPTTRYYSNPGIRARPGAAEPAEDEPA